MITICCVLKSSGSKIYDPEWVYKLERAVNRNISIPYKFVCLTDIALTCDHIFLDDQASGWWSKMQLFKPKLFDSETLYFDLDVIITKPLDDLILELRNASSSFFMCREPSGVVNSSIMYWKSDNSSLYNTYIQNPTKYQETYASMPLLGDQGFISEHVKYDLIENYLPKNYIAWTGKFKLNDTDSTGLVIFTGIKSKPSKVDFSNTLILKSHWI